jgi:FlaG/FlaF family flagellin (archaellin)
MLAFIAGLISAVGVGAALGIVGGVVAVAGGVILGAVLGSATIAANATKYAAEQQRLGQEHTADKQAEADETLYKLDYKTSEADRKLDAKESAQRAKEEAGWLAQFGQIDDIQTTESYKTDSRGREKVDAGSQDYNYPQPLIFS